MDAISHLECKLNQLALTLHPPMPAEPTGEVLNKYTNTLSNTQNVLCKLLATRYHNTEWK